LYVLNVLYLTVLYLVQPSNVLYLLHSTDWRLLDLGIVARAGARLRAGHAALLSRCLRPKQTGLAAQCSTHATDRCCVLGRYHSTYFEKAYAPRACALPDPRPRAGEALRARCSLAYAPPEVALAALYSATVTAAPAHDIRAVGVMAFKTITRARALASQADVADCASGRARYPWELPPAEQPPTWRQSCLRPLLERCLARDAAARARERASRGGVIEGRMGEV
jgi:hypothetical protein